MDLLAEENHTDLSPYQRTAGERSHILQNIQLLAGGWDHSGWVVVVVGVMVVVVVVVVMVVVVSMVVVVVVVGGGHGGCGGGGVGWL